MSKRAQSSAVKAAKKAKETEEVQEKEHGNITAITNPTNNNNETRNSNNNSNNNDGMGDKGNNNNTTTNNNNNTNFSLSMGLHMPTLAPLTKRNCTLVKPSSGKKDPFWTDFGFYPFKLSKVVNVSETVVCKLCFEMYKNNDGVDPSVWEVGVSKEQTPTHLRAHFRTHHNDVYQARLVEETKREQAISNTNLDKHIAVSRQKVVEEKLLDFIHNNMQPFSVVEDHDFRQYSAALNAHAPVFSVEYISEQMAKRAIEDRLFLQTYFTEQKRTGLTVAADCWTSNNNETYMIFTASWVDANWQRHFITLDCVLFEGHTTADDISDKLQAVIASFDISSDQVICVVQDNEPSNNAAGRLIPWEWVGCSDHIIEMILGVVLKHASVQKDLEACRALITQVTGSSQLASQLQLQQESMNPNTTPLSIIQDVRTRWSSTHAMLDRLYALRRYLQALHSLQLLEKSLTEDQWELVGCLTTILKPFAKIQEFLEASSYLTASWVPYVVFQIRKMLTKLCADLEGKSGVYAKLHSLAVAMKDKFESRWGTGGVHQTIGRRLVRVGVPRPVWICAAVDIRTKELRFLSEQERVAVNQMLTDEVVKLLKTKKPAVPSPSTATSKQVDDKVARNQVAILNCFEDFTEYFGASSTTSATTNNEVTAIDDSETLERARVAVAAWAQVQQADMKEHIDPLRWWQTQEASHPYIAAVAMRYFSIVATSAECERAASTAGRVVEDRRSKLSPENVRNLVFLHDSHEKIKVLKDLRSKQ